MDYQEFGRSGKWKWSAIKLALVLLPAVYFIYTFFKTLACQNGAMGCNIMDSVVVFPFYFVLSSFINQLSSLGYFFLYVFSSAVYLAIFYHFAGWFEDVYLRMKYPADFRLKRV